jgi:hypothetical protein
MRGKKPAEFDPAHAGRASIAMESRAENALRIFMVKEELGVFVTARIQSAPRLFHKGHAV